MIVLQYLTDLYQLFNWLHEYFINTQTSCLLGREHSRSQCRFRYSLNLVLKLNTCQLFSLFLHGYILYLCYLNARCHWVHRGHLRRVSGPASQLYPTDYSTCPQGLSGTLHSVRPSDNFGDRLLRKSDIFQVYIIPELDLLYYQVIGLIDHFSELFRVYHSDPDIKKFCREQSETLSTG